MMISVSGDNLTKNMEASMNVLFLVALNILTASGQTCSQYFTAKSGWITAPDQDGDGYYDIHSSCWYSIEAGRDQAINVTVIYANISCSDYLLIIDGASVIWRVCETTQTTFLSDSKLIRLYFGSDATFHRGGFNISYEQVEDPFCGFYVWGTGLIGSHDTDFYRDNYIISQGAPLCSWVIQRIHSYLAVQLYLSKFDAVPCVFGDVYGGFIEVFGFNRLDRKTKFYCDENYSDRVVTVYGTSMLHIELTLPHSESTTLHLFFSSADANSTTPCGGILINRTGVITPSDFDRDGYYDNGANCAWTIVAPENYTIAFEFDYIDVEYTPNCEYDSITIYNEPWKFGTLIQTLCGRMSTSEVRSNLVAHRTKTNILVLRFLSDEIENAHGFSFTYRHTNVTSEPCRVRLLEESGSFGYPKDTGMAHRDVDCSWTVEVFSDKVVVIVFHETEFRGNTLCGMDELAIYDGFFEVDRICTEDTLGHEQYTSEARSMRIELVVDDSSIVLFNATYSIRDDSHCGYTISKKAGGFGSFDTELNRYSENYVPPLNGYRDHRYESGIHCIWTIQRHHFESSVIQVYIAKLIFHRKTSSCLKNYVEVYDDSSAVDVNYVCDAESKVTISTALRLVFVRLIRESDDTDVTFEAFHAETDDQSTCGGVLTSKSAEIRSPSGDKSGYYDNNLECVWTILAPKGYVVDLEFMHVDLEDDDECRYDYIEVFDGIFKEDASVLRICGYWPSPEEIWVIKNTPEVKTNVVIIQFRSDTTIRKKGFHIAFDHLKATPPPCGGVLTDESGLVGSPDYNNDGFYDSNAECLWTLEATRDKVIYIQFVKMMIDCDSDSVTIYDGFSVKEQYCGRTIPESITSQARWVRIKFVSDDSPSKGGFKVTYKLMDDSRCGYLTSNIAGRFGSSDTAINKFLNPSISCIWEIKVSPDYSALQIYVTNLEFSGQNEACRKNVLQIFKDTNLFGSYRDTSDANVITTEFDIIDVFLTSATEVSFDAVYVSINDSQACGGILTHSSGEIRSVDRDKDNVYENNLNCVWILIAPQNHVIEFDFEYIDIEGDKNCTNDSIQLFDSFFDETSRVLLICGHWASPGELWSAMNVTKVETNMLIVQFLTNKQVGKLGFVMTYEWRSLIQVQENRAAWKMTSLITIYCLLLLIVSISVV